MIPPKSDSKNLHILEEENSQISDSDKRNKKVCIENKN